MQVLRRPDGVAQPVARRRLADHLLQGVPQGEVVSLPRFAARVDSSPVLRVELPWPPRILHPNDRAHWAPKSRAAKQSREVAGLLTLNRLGGSRPTFGERIPVRLTFKPPNNNKHDIDGCLSANKHALDGVADALQVDDSRFQLELRKGEKIKGGMVIVEIGA